MKWITLILFVFTGFAIVGSNTVSKAVGCYADFFPASRAMTDASTTSSSNTPSTCAAFCATFGIPYSGTEYGNECHCSRTAPQTTSNACTMACPGDAKQICGGPNAISVFHTTIPKLPATNSTKPKAIPWLYNWELWDPRPAGTSTAEYVPMCRTKAEAPKITQFLSNCAAKNFLGFNEPDLPTAHGGDYISPYDASVLWKQYIEPLKKSCRTALGAPAVTNGDGAGWGTDWLRQLFGNCTSPSCSFDFLPIHWYGNSLSNFQTYVQKVHSLYPKYPLWITEWQFTDISSAETVILVKSALQWLDAQNYVVRYSIFGPMNAANMAGIPKGALITDDLRGLTDVGKIYAGLM